MVYSDTEGRTYSGDGRTFSSAELYVASRTGRLIVRKDGSNGFYVTITDENDEDEGRTFHVTRD